MANKKEEKAALKAERDAARAKIKADKEAEKAKLQAEKDAAKAAKKAAKEGKVVGADPKAVAPATAPALKVVEFEGATVLKVLETKHTATYFHCQMSDGTSKHVPKELFD